MGTTTKIEWTDHTFNPWCGCTKVSDGCKNCYAESKAPINPAVLGGWGKNGSRVVKTEKGWADPFVWNRTASAEGIRRRVFCSSMADVFEGRDMMPEASWLPVEAARERLWDVIARTPMLDWLLLTKRPQNIPTRVWPDNVGIGTSIENQQTADERIPHLLAVPARVRFLSMEPLIGPVNLRPWLGDLNWVIVGGENTARAKARRMHPDWVRTIRDQCADACVPFFFKQWGTIDATGRAVGKDNAGRMLDERTWDEYPA